MFGDADGVARLRAAVAASRGDTGRQRGERRHVSASVTSSLPFNSSSSSSNSIMAMHHVVPSHSESFTASAALCRQAHSPSRSFCSTKFVSDVYESWNQERLVAAAHRDAAWSLLAQRGAAALAAREEEAQLQGRFIAFGLGNEADPDREGPRLSKLERTKKELLRCLDARQDRLTTIDRIMDRRHMYSGEADAKMARIHRAEVRHAEVASRSHRLALAPLQQPRSFGRAGATAVAEAEEAATFSEYETPDSLGSLMDDFTIPTGELPRTFVPVGGSMFATEFLLRMQDDHNGPPRRRTSSCVSSNASLKT